MSSKNNECRSNEFKRNLELEKYLKEINLNLEGCENKLLKEKICEYPVVFIMGSLRSGTTLMTQWLADTNEFAYPTNLLSRFYGAPIMGAKIQRLLTDPKYNFRNEILDFQSGISFESNNGKTKGALEPNEFWYLWRRFLPDDVYMYTDEELLNMVDIDLMRKEFWGIAQVFDKPLILKGMICNYNIGFLNKVFPKSIFIWTKRNLESNTRSVIEARKRQYGTENEWYSFKIPEYSRIITIENVKEQVQEQIRCINSAIERGLSEISEEKKIVVQYENFCKQPQLVYNEIYRKLKEQGYSIDKHYKGIEYFSAR